MQQNGLKASYGEIKREFMFDDIMKLINKIKETGEQLWHRLTKKGVYNCLCKLQCGYN